jgi:hypothetical protein
LFIIWPCVFFSQRTCPTARPVRNHILLRTLVEKELPSAKASALAEDGQVEVMASCGKLWQDDAILQIAAMHIFISVSDEGGSSQSQSRRCSSVILALIFPAGLRIL